MNGKFKPPQSAPVFQQSAQLQCNLSAVGTMCPVKKHPANPNVHFHERVILNCYPCRVIRGGLGHDCLLTFILAITFCGGGGFLIDDGHSNSSQTTAVHMCSEIYAVAEDIDTFILLLTSQNFFLFVPRTLKWTGFEITSR